MEEQIQRLTDVNEMVRKQMNNMQNSMNEALKEKTQVQAELQGLQQELENLRQGGTKSRSESVNEGEQQGAVDNENKLDSGLVESHFSMDDQERLARAASKRSRNPDKPRFTLRELQKVLWERDLLKMQVYTLEDELSHYKPR